jgi:PAS domain S-box-containing protein
VVVEGRLVGARGTFIDITEQKQARELLERSEAKFRKAFNTSPDAVNINCLENGLHVSINDGFSRLTGYSEEEVIGKTAEEFNIWVDQADRQRLLAGLQRDGEVKNLEAAFRMKDGTIRYGLMSASLIDLNGTPHVVTMTRDITERKREEEERLRLHERLNRTEKIEALGTLAGGVAHDLNNVLGVLIGYAELILQHLPPGSPLKPYANKIMDGGQRATAIIQDLLTLARRGVVVSEVVNLNQMVSSFLDTPEFAMMRSHHPEVVFQSVSDPHLLNIKGSPVHLAKTLMNLVSNAAEAISGPGKVTIRTQNRYLDHPLPTYEETQEGEYAVLSVSDTGKGIPATDIKRIFEPFYTKKVMGRSGTGLGLAVVWGTVKDHRGYIDVRSEDGQGSTFTLYFPASREAVREERRSASRELFQGKGERILVVDDVEGQRDLASALLTGMGYQVQAVAGGEEAVAHVVENPVDLLVLDMIMDPGIDGLETYRRILKIHPGQKAVIVSGFAEDERVKTAQQLGAGAYIRKPYLREVIGLAVRRELDRVARREAP